MCLSHSVLRSGRFGEKDMAEEKGNSGVIGLRAFWDDFERNLFTVPTKAKFLQCCCCCALLNDADIPEINVGGS
jgi:hypothetical protein